MNKDESVIRSTSVNLGARPSGNGAPVSEQTKPWIVMVCADLGFTSEQPCRITAASLNEVLSTSDVSISGTVKNGLPDEIAPFHIEYPIKDSKDLSVSALAEKLPMLTQLKTVGAHLEDISAGRVPAAGGLKKIAAMPLPQSIMQLVGKIGTTRKSGPALQQTTDSSNVDSILSMVNIDSVTEDGKETSSPEPDFVSTFTEAGVTEFSRAALLSCLEAVNMLVKDLAGIVMNQPFFSAAVSSWTSLKTLLKIAGRNRNVHCYLHGAPYNAAQRHFADALTACAAQSGSPDLVVWDYPVELDTASLEQLGTIGETADRFKTIVVSSLEYHTELYEKILEGEPLKTVMEQPAYIPLRRLQESAPARCLSLFAPDAQHARGEHLRISSGWLFAFQWLTSVIENSAPFHLQNSSIMALDACTVPKLSRDGIADGFQVGLTLMQPGAITVPRVLLGAADSPYGNLLFNMLVNRTARLAAEWITAQDRSLPLEQAAPALEQFLRNNLESYHILSSEDAVAVTIEGAQSLEVTINSTVTVGGFPAQFQFSFNYRG
jgi:predicted component of type VI protein secretion system